MTTDTPAWLDLGPAEFDARRMPRGHKPGTEGQAGLFFVAVPPKPVRSAPAAELPGQSDIFDVLSGSES